MVEWRRTHLEDYDVSDHGALRLRVNKSNLIAGHILKGSISKGYLTYRLRIDGKKRTQYAHRLVLKSFVGEPPTLKHQAAHWDGNPLNNHYSNLRWATVAENTADKVRHGRHLNGPRKFTKEDVLDMRAMHKAGNPYSRIIEKYKISKGNLSSIINRHTWDYIEDEEIDMTKPDGEPAHSKLGASSTSRWMNCPGSVEATKDYPDTKNIYAAEGTAAHSIGDACLKTNTDATTCLGNVITVDDWEFEVNREMVEGVQMYLDVVRTDMEEMGAKKIHAERRVDLSKVYPGMFGTSDAILIEGKYLKVYDFKYGRGIVEVRENTQALFYAVGALLLMDPKREVQEIEMVIVQPRVADPIKRWTVTKQYIRDWVVELRKAAVATAADDAPRIPGEKQCKFCEHKPFCPEIEKFALECAMLEFDEEDNIKIIETDDLSKTELSKILKWSSFVQNYLKAIESKALRLLQEGESVEGFKLVDKRPSRQWDKDLDIEEILRHMGLSRLEMLTEPVLLSPAQIEKLLPQELREELNNDLIVKKSSGTKMVPESDPAPEVSAGVESDFADD
jgi:hypothetical protein